MSGFIEKINLKEKAEEDLYFAKQNAKLIQAIHDQQLLSDKPKKVQEKVAKHEKK